MGRSRAAIGVQNSASGPARVPRHRMRLRRTATPVMAAAALATLMLAGCGLGAPPGGGITSPLPVKTLHVVDNTNFWRSPDNSYEIKRSCVAGRTVYFGEAYPGPDNYGGGVAYGPLGCVRGSDFRVIGPPQHVDGHNNTIRPVCDRRNGTLIYSTEQEWGGSIGTILNGCVPGAPKPGSIVPAGPVQYLGGPGTLSVRAFTDRGNGALLYISEAGDRWGSDNNNGGGVYAVAHPTGAPGQIVRLTQWEGPIDANYTPSSLADFCDMGNGNLLIGAAVQNGGNVAAVQGACSAVADGQVPPTQYKGPAHYVPTSRWYHFDQYTMWDKLLCGLSNGITVNFIEANSQGGVAVLPGHCLADAGGLR